jgi:hypothetical protein
MRTLQLAARAATAAYQQVVVDAYGQMTNYSPPGMQKAAQSASLRLCQVLVGPLLLMQLCTVRQPPEHAALPFPASLLQAANSCKLPASWPANLLWNCCVPPTTARQTQAYATPLT